MLKNSAQCDRMNIKMNVAMKCNSPNASSYFTASTNQVK